MPGLNRSRGVRPTVRSHRPRGGQARGPVPPAAPSPHPQAPLLGVLDVLIGVAYWFALVAVAARLRALLVRPEVCRHWELTTGRLFIAIGVGVAAAA
ncbi:hypothetical protein ACF061_15660 [Streptomyces sp. NPDC015220]|uniref:hypothetical protein n=1 Tax=Streptomyces sp. NPDC015220 TaxID=3364947 RepID=UPI0036FB6D15